MKINVTLDTQLTVDELAHVLNMLWLMTNLPDGRGTSIQCNSSTWNVAQKQWGQASALRWEENSVKNGS